MHQTHAGVGLAPAGRDAHKNANTRPDKQKHCHLYMTVTQAALEASFGLHAAEARPSQGATRKLRRVRMVSSWSCHSSLLGACSVSGPATEQLRFETECSGESQHDCLHAHAQESARDTPAILLHMSPISSIYITFTIAMSCHSLCETVHTYPSDARCLTPSVKLDSLR
jgi:hypothetical protein